MNTDGSSATSSDGFLSTGLWDRPDSAMLAAAVASGRRSLKTPQTPRCASTFGQDKMCGRRLSKACAGARPHEEKSAMRLAESEAAADIHTISVSRLPRSQGRGLAMFAHYCAILTTIWQCRTVLSDGRLVSCVCKALKGLVCVHEKSLQL